jgi:hypothetical protein
VKTVTLIECDTESLFNQFMGRGRIISASPHTFLTRMMDDARKLNLEDDTADMKLEYPNKKSMLITITGKDDTVKKTYNQNEKEVKRLKNRIILKNMRTKITNTIG